MDLLQRGAQLFDKINGVIDEFRGEKAARDALVGQYIANARKEYGGICLSKNQKMAVRPDGLGIVDFSHLNMTLNCTIAATLTNSDGSVRNVYQNNTAREYCIAVGEPYVQGGGYNIVQVDWNVPPVAVAAPSARFAQTYPDPITGIGMTTTAAYIKLLSGTVGGDFSLKKELPNGWGLYGHHSNGRINSHSGMLLTSASGSMLIALHGTVTGRLALESNNWGLFPSLRS